MLESFISLRENRSPVMGIDMTNKIDAEIIASLMLEISDRINLTLKMIPNNEDNNQILKHLAAASIHVALFMKDVHDFTVNKKTEIKEDYIKKFLESCGCSDDKS